VLLPLYLLSDRESGSLLKRSKQTQHNLRIVCAHNKTRALQNLKNYSTWSWPTTFSCTSAGLMTRLAIWSRSFLSSKQEQLWGNVKLKMIYSIISQKRTDKSETKLHQWYIEIEDKSCVSACNTVFCLQHSEEEPSIHCCGSDPDRPKYEPWWILSSLPTMLIDRLGCRSKHSRFRIRILLFSSVTLRMPTKNKYFFLSFLAYGYFL
jgi:hypothetical protein